MGLGRTLLRPAAYLAGLHARRQLEQFHQAHQHTEQVQRRLLRRLLAAHAETDFGRDHDFANIDGYARFKTAAPLKRYEDLQPYVERVLAGQTRALLPPGERVRMFSLTSGTTGQPKHIPVTDRFLADIRRGWNIFGMAAYRDHPEAWLRPILQISSRVDERRSPTGLPCGAISGLLAATQKRIVRRMYAAPREAMRTDDPQDKYYLLMRWSVGRDVAFITTANPSTTVRLIETAQTHAERLLRDVADGTVRPPGGWTPRNGTPRFRPDRALARRLEAGIVRDGRLLPRHFWDLTFLANWTGGTLGLYLPRLRELFGDLPVRDIGLLASEGRFSIPLSDDTPAGVAEITGNFLEFIPAECNEDSDPPTLPAHEVLPGREYFLVVSNWAGLWRYRMDDRVRVVGRRGSSPVFAFLCRGQHTANITGEKITEHQVVEAMRQAGAVEGDAPERFVLQGRFGRVPYYELRLPESDEERAQRLARRMDEALAELNIEYRSKRHSGRLGCIRAVRIGKEQMDRAEAEQIRRRHGRSEQYKHQYLKTEVLGEAEPPGREHA